MIDDIMDKEKYGNLVRTAEDWTRWIGRIKQQTDVTCQKPATIYSRLYYKKKIIWEPMIYVKLDSIRDHCTIMLMPLNNYIDTTCVPCH